MRETRQSGSEGGGAKPIVSPYPLSKEFPHGLASGRLISCCWSLIEHQPPVIAVGSNGS